MGLCAGYFAGMPDESIYRGKCTPRHPPDLHGRLFTTLNRPRSSDPLVFFALKMPGNNRPPRKGGESA
jgi:hypothetical protein